MLNHSIENFAQHASANLRILTLPKRKPVIEKTSYDQFEESCCSMQQWFKHWNSEREIRLAQQTLYFSLVFIREVNTWDVWYIISSQSLLLSKKLLPSDFRRNLNDYRKQLKSLDLNEHPMNILFSSSCQFIWNGPVGLTTAVSARTSFWSVQMRSVTCDNFHCNPILIKNVFVKTMVFTLILMIREILDNLISIICSA